MHSKYKWTFNCGEISNIICHSSTYNHTFYKPILAVWHLGPRPAVRSFLRLAWSLHFTHRNTGLSKVYPPLVRLNFYAHSNDFICLEGIPPASCLRVDANFDQPEIQLLDPNEHAISITPISEIWAPKYKLYFDGWYQGPTGVKKTQGDRCSNRWDARRPVLPQANQSRWSSHLYSVSTRMRTKSTFVPIKMKRINK